MSEDGPDIYSFERGKARLNPSVAAMMRRGLDNALATRLQAAGVTLAALSQMTNAELTAQGLTSSQMLSVRQGGRAAIPFDTLTQVLWANRFTCCVCRDPSLAIILHHIVPWATSRDHAAGNLAVLCLEHHARAHRKGDLEQNLSARQLRDFKARWEEDVRHLDPKAILDASRAKGHHWMWFNHVRVFEMAHRLNIELTKLPGYAIARAWRLVEKDGLLRPRGKDTSYMYAGGEGIPLYGYVRDVVEAVLGRSAVFNISDDLDPGLLSRVISPGDIIHVAGKHLFKRLTRNETGPGQSSEVRRQANGVQISFTIDRWEGVANSAWATWLVGAQSASSVVRVANVERDGGKLKLRCTGLAMGSALQGLAQRSYVCGTWPDTSIEDIESEDDNWLDGFGVEGPEAVQPATR